MSTSVAVSDGGDAQQSENLNLILAFFAALSDGRYDDAQALLRPQASWWVLHKRGYVDPAIWFSGLANLFPEGLQFKVVGTTVEGPRIALRAEASGKTVTGREFDNAYHFLFEIDAGRICAAWEYGDTLHADRILRG
ncbi:nuclear transport factor 2 family protein [Mycobacterium sp.]|uniref:nuclear transport factor 2 family protein n=1 Tax=Mycobacterium sp. TaxID=1785 RepID=UPI003BAE2C24